MQELRFWMYIALLVSCIVAGVVRFNKLTTPFSLLCLSILLTVQNELAAHFMGIKFKNNLILYHFFTPVHFIFFALIFYHLFLFKSSRKILLVSIIIFLAFAVINSSFFQTLNKFPTYTILLESFLLAFFAIRSSYEIQSNPNSNNLMKNSVFWLNASIIIFYTSCFVFFGFHNLLQKDYKQLLKNLYLLLWFLDMMMYTGFLVALLLDKPATSKENS